MLLSTVDAVTESHPSSRIVAAGGEARFPASVSRAEVAEATAEFESLRSRLFGIAYQTLGGIAEAEDVVQDVWIRWQGADRAQVRDRVAFLVTITTRVSLNAATSARARREISVGAFLPDGDAASTDPAVGAERSEALDVAIELLMERLSPAERAVFVLREAFDYPFRDIAETLELTEANARQIARRARARLAESRRNPVDRAERRGVLCAFLGAARAGDMAGLVDVLAGDRVVRDLGGRTAERGPLAPAV